MLREGESTVGKRVWQSSALVSPTIALNRDAAPIGDDIEPVGESRAEVEMGNGEEQEPEDRGGVGYRSWCAVCAKGRWRMKEENEEPQWWFLIAVS